MRTLSTVLTAGVLVILLGSSTGAQPASATAPAFSPVEVPEQMGTL